MDKYIDMIEQLKSHYHTYQMIADKCGVNKSTIWRLHNQRSTANPTLTTINNLTHAYNKVIRIQADECKSMDKNHS